MTSSWTHRQLPTDDAARPANPPSSGSDEDDPIHQKLRQLSQRHPGLQQTPTVHGGASVIRAEIDRYLQTPVAAKGSDILTWWKGMSSEAYPKLGRLARRYLCIPAASTASERIFSDAGNVVTWSRSKLHVNNVEKLVYVKENSKFVNLKV